MTPPHSSAGFSPLFSNAAPDPAVEHSAGADRTPRNPQSAEQKRTAQQRSELNGDHHLVFLDLDDTAPNRR